MSDMDLVELASGMRPAGYFEDGSSFVKMMEAGICMGLQRTLVELDMFARALSLAIGRVGEPDGRCGGVA